MKKICVVGRFGDGMNGQTIKTKTITNQLAKIYGENQILKIDTYGGIKKLFTLPFLMKKVLNECENIIILPAYKGVRVISPSLIFWNKKLNRKLHYVVIGGWLPEFLKNKKTLSKNLKKFDKIYVETQSMMNALEKMEFRNVCVMPNCKELEIVNTENCKLDNNMPLKLCTFSRVTPSKGIDDAIRAVTLVNDKVGKKVFTLDIFGQISENDGEWFNSLSKDFPDYINYLGEIKYTETTSVLKNFFLLLFPTFYSGEGFAGTLIDAYSAGLPVIASDWKYNSELVEDGSTGFILPIKSPQIWADKLFEIYENTDLILKMKENCISKAKEYDINNAIKILTDEIDK